jgi:hypothetical protein
LVHAVVAILVELSVFAKMVELIRGCDVKVAIPFNVLVEVPVPKVIEPVVKLAPIVIAEVTEDALITFTVAVEMFKAETLIEEKDCTEDHV